MTSGASGRNEGPAAPGPGLKDQAIVTIKVLFVTGAVFAAIWLLDLLAAQ